MPQTEGYVYLNENSVYQTTTEPTMKSYSVLDTVKEAFAHASGSKANNQDFSNKNNSR